VKRKGSHHSKKYIPTRDFNFLVSFKAPHINEQEQPELKGTIISLEQFKSYKKEYEDKHKTYIDIYSNLKENEKHFNKLGEYYLQAESDEEKDYIKKKNKICI